MIELRSRKSGINSEGDKYDFFDLFIDDKIIPGIHADRWNNDEIDIEFHEEFILKELLKKAGKYRIDNLICLDKVSLPYSISSWGGKHYIWEKIFTRSFQQITIKNSNKNSALSLTFYLNDEDLFDWTYKYSPNHIFNQLPLIQHNKVDVKIQRESDSVSVQIELKKEFTTTLSISYSELKKAIYEIEQELYERLASFIWNDEYNTDEPKFTKEVMIPLLKKMKYKNVRYNHGTEEYGRDVIFSEINKFQEEIFYGIQVKAGDVSGGANSQIDTLIAQLDDAFCMPFKLLGNEHERYLSFFIIAISGHYKKNAKEKILKKVPQAYKQNVFFWDKDKIEDLIGTYWKAD